MRLADGDERRALLKRHEHVGRVVEPELALAGGDELHHVGGPGGKRLV